MFVIYIAMSSGRRFNLDNRIAMCLGRLPKLKKQQVLLMMTMVCPRVHGIREMTSPCTIIINSTESVHSLVKIKIVGNVIIFMSYA